MTNSYNRNYLIQFVIGLNDMYDTICCQFLLMEPIPSVANAYSMVMRVEKTDVTHSSNVELFDQSAHMVRSGSYAKPGSSHFNFGKDAKGNKGDRIYTYYKEDNHSRKDFFKLIGYLDWWKSSKKKGKVPA